MRRQFLSIYLYFYYFRSILQNGSLLIKNIFNDEEKDTSEGFEAYQCVAFVDNIGSAVSRIATITLARTVYLLAFYVNRFLYYY